jgi:hypothetical protein
VAGLVLAGSLALCLTPHRAGAQAVAPDSSFRAEERHAVNPVAEPGPRQGWLENEDGIRFGRYGLRVIQRLDPATGLPPSRGQVWGDTFVGISGHKPADYMASNWSPWDFLSACVRLAGDTADLLNPSRTGRLAYAIRREVTANRVVGEAAWRDLAGGYLRARCVGWRQSPRFGLALRYFPPAARAAEAVAFTLVCQPYDYSDRGYWERRRVVVTGRREVELGRDAVSFDPTREAVFVFANRSAQNDAGTVLAVAPASVRAVTVSADGNTVPIVVQPSAPAAEAALVLGDWVGEAASIAADCCFAQTATIDAELHEVARVTLPSPAVPEAQEAADIDALLQAHAVLRDRFGAPVDQARRALRTAVEAAARVDEPATVAAWYRAVEDLTALNRQVRGAWVTDRLFATVAKAGGKQ